MLLSALRAEVSRLHALLPGYHLVAWTSGNISARDPSTGLIVIKPSGLHYDQLTAETMVVVDADGQVVEGDLLPSSDTALALLPLSSATRSSRRRPYPFAVRHGLCRARLGDPMCADRHD